MSLAEKSSPQEIAAADVLRKLAIVWTEFEGRLEATPLIRKLTGGLYKIQMISGEGLGPNGTTLKMSPAPDWEKVWKKDDWNSLRARIDDASASDHDRR